MHLSLSLLFSGVVLPGAIASRITLIPPPNLDSAEASTRPKDLTLNAIWSKGPGNDWYSGAYPIGNGYLGEMISGDPGNDTHWINIASLWIGGPFRNASYSGGNGPVSAIPYFSSVLAQTRSEISKTGTGTLDGLMGNDNDPDYGTYTTAGALTITSPTLNADISKYTRALDFDQGLVNITWVEGGATFSRISFCSFPDKICATYTRVSGKKAALSLGYSLATPLTNVPQATCDDIENTIKQRGRVSNDTVGETQSMLYEVQAKVFSIGGHIRCTRDSNRDAVLEVSNATESLVIWSGETEFNLENCSRAGNFSCRGDDPAEAVTQIIAAASVKSFSELLHTHVEDYSALSSAFQLDIGQANNETAISLPTDDLMNEFDYFLGSPLLEHNVYSYGRHLLISSTRVGSRNLPPNLQGLWSQSPSGPWGADFHSDINIQMMQWPGEPTGIAEGIQNTGNWLLSAMADRGTDTARILYGLDGFVIHTASNVFGYTGMQGFDGGSYHPEWHDLTAGAAWIIQHLYDDFVYNPMEVDFFRGVTWPLMKRHAQFQMRFLVNDTYFDDGTLVISPCNSPEQTYTSLGCTWNQQQIFELLHNIRKTYADSGDHDPDFMSAVEATLDRMYDGVSIGSWGQLQEWKIDHDSPTDQHRHLSHMLGVFPGWQISGYIGQSLGNQTVLDACAISLAARGNGSEDGDPGWAKIMRSVVGSSLGDSTSAIFELRFMIWSNLNGNLLSMYSGHSSVFQMDANGGASAAVVNMLFQSLDSTKEFRSATHVAVLPALPVSWPRGSLSGGRLRDGLGISISWSENVLERIVLTSDRATQDRTVVLHSAGFIGRKIEESSDNVSRDGATVTVLLSRGSSIDIAISSD